MLSMLDRKLGKVIAKFQKRYFYRFPSSMDVPWFQVPLTQGEVYQLISGLKSLYEGEESAEINHANKLLRCMILELFGYDIDPAGVQCVPLENIIVKFELEKQYDVFVCALIMTLISTAHSKARASRLLSLKGHLHLDPTVWVILEEISTGEIKRIYKADVLGEGLHNKTARLNGMAEQGWFQYKDYMKSMKQGKVLPKLKAQFDFLNHLPVNTLGGHLCKILRQQKLSLPGESGGFPPFFLWHDLGHVLSGNGTDYPGELGANAFTAGCSQYAKFKILIWGLLQFNGGLSLAVVAKPAKDDLLDVLHLQQYIKSLLSGCRSQLDILDWPLDNLIDDLSQPLQAVRTKYAILDFREVSVVE